MVVTFAGTRGWKRDRSNGGLVGWLPKFCPLTRVAVTMVAALQRFNKLYTSFVWFSVSIFYFIVKGKKQTKTFKIPLAVVRRMEFCGARSWQTSWKAAALV